MPVSKRLAPFGTTIFTEITRKAIAHQAINLGQGFPDFEGPDFIKDAACAAIRDHPNQYAPLAGLPILTQTIADHWSSRTNQTLDPASQVTVTCGATEAISAALLGLLNPGDEVVLFEPFYDSYRAGIAMAGGIPRCLPLRWPTFRFDPDELSACITPHTRAILINTPHNPTGRIFDDAELQTIADLCHQHDLIAISDEVYEHLVYDAPHRSLATLPGMADRTITISSLGKTFSLTGWKIGWAIASADLTRAVRSAHQFLTFAIATPLQHGAAAALKAPPAFYEDLRTSFRTRRDMLCDELDAIGFPIVRPQGGYFVMADHTPFSEPAGLDNDLAFCDALIKRIGVAAIPPSCFYEHKEYARTLVRFAFCKSEQTLRAAVERLEKLPAAFATA